MNNMKYYFQEESIPQKKVIIINESNEDRLIKLMNDDKLVKLIIIKKKSTMEVVQNDTLSLDTKKFSIQEVIDS